VAGGGKDTLLVACGNLVAGDGLQGRSLDAATASHCTTAPGA
jgi:hypothetical protein